MTLNLTSFDGALKEYYTDQVVENMVYKKNPALALMPKREDFYGRNWPIPIVYGNPQGRSATFTNAQNRGQSESSRIKEFLLTRVHDYGVATIDNETMEASENDSGAFMQASTVEIDGIINSVTRSCAISMFRAGYGGIGVIATAGITTVTITLATVDDVTNFEVGQELVLAATDSSSALRALGTSGNGIIVTAVDRGAGTLTFGYNVTDATNGIPLAAAGDVIFVRGDRDNSATPTRFKIAGLGAWLPYTAPTSGDSFFGVDRSVDVVRLAGVRYDGSAAPIEEAVIELATRIAREGGSPDTCFMNFAKYSAFEKALGAKVTYQDLAVGEVGFRSILINGPNGDIRVIPDQNCPLTRMYMLTLDTWELCSLKKMVRFLPGDGNKMLRQATADGVEVRVGGYLNLGCNAPGWNGVANI